MKRFYLIIWASFFVLHCVAQKNDSVPGRKNTIKLNLVSSFIYSNSAALSYERETRPNRSWGVMLGYVEFPQLGNLGSSISTSTIKRNSGVVVGGEYRFYLARENKYKGPHGVYIGPYANYFNFNNERMLKYTAPDGSTDNASMTTSISVLNVGAELGYQFVLNDRWTFDFIFFGPSISRYALDVSLDGFDQAGQGIVRDELVKALTDRFPLIKDLLEDQKIDVNGNTSRWGTGFRYQLNIGYHFGGKKSRG